jgi:hypothetical protein
MDARCPHHLPNSLPAHGRPLLEFSFRELRFDVIVILYAAIGLMAAAGAIYIGQQIFAPKAEQIFYAMFL